MDASGIESRLERDLKWDLDRKDAFRYFTSDEPSRWQMKLRHSHFTTLPAYLLRLNQSARNTQSQRRISLLRVRLNAFDVNQC
jgi:hypothetical protein